MDAFNALPSLYVLFSQDINLEVTTGIDSIIFMESVTKEERTLLSLAIPLLMLRDDPSTH